MRGDVEIHGQLNKRTETVINCIIKVHRTLGPGFLEVIYRRALVLELKRRGVFVETEKKINIYYEGREIGQHRLDILVERNLIIELKTVEQLSKAHYAQVRSYLKATALPVALLVNFSNEKADFRRVEA